MGSQPVRVDASATANVAPDGPSPADRGDVIRSCEPGRITPTP
ncbi:MAG: hypothetical protein QGI49_12650 [SAR202 cluster bacterium]|nr:hypothetical protein [SAR202 cluster bacterium]